MSVYDYPVFERKADVPPGAFANPDLVVERFLPETDGRFYYVRWHSFLGDHDYTLRAQATGPVVKGPCIVSSEPCEPHDEITDLRRALGWDYGKFDYVVRDGRAILLDTNKTPGKGRTESTAQFARLLGNGVFSLLNRNRA